MLINVAGSYYEQGKLHGQQAKELILQNIDTVKKVVQEANVKWDVYYSYVRKNLSYLNEHCVALMDEMRGISDGSGIAFDEILLINIQLFFLANKLSNECSTIIARGPATLDHKTYIVKNRDMRGAYKHVILRRTFSNALKISEVHVAGTVTYPGSGMNNKGLAVSSTGVWSNKYPLNLDLISQSELQLNLHSILRNCTSIDDVVEFIKQRKRMIRLNLFAIDKNRAAVCEVVDDDFAVMYDENGILVRSNHFHSGKLRDYNQTPSEYPSTYFRYDRATTFLNELHGTIRFQDMLQIASDHENDSNSICRHDAVAGPTTSYSSICILEDGQIWTSLRNPCESLILSSI